MKTEVIRYQKVVGVDEGGFAIVQDAAVLMNVPEPGDPVLDRETIERTLGHRLSP